MVNAIASKRVTTQAENQVESLELEVDIETDGYIYIYVANESTNDVNVFFDDLTVTHLGAKLLQTTDYYPFGAVASQWTDEDYRFGYQGLFTENDPETGLVHFEARNYDPIAGRWLAVDPQGQFASPYTGMGNMPNLGVDPDGEFVLSLISKIVAGDIDNVGDVFRTILTGLITDPINIIGALNPVNIFSTGVGIISGLGDGIFNGDWDKLGNTGEIFLGQFYTDNNRSVFGEILQGVGRNTWELPQTTVGYNYSQWRNTSGKVDRVELFGGATFSLQEYGDGSGISLGNFINANLPGKFRGVPNDPLLMHEYGHTFDSQLFGSLYLPVVGLSSTRSANKAVYDPTTGGTTHDTHWTERRANRPCCEIL